MINSLYDYEQDTIWTCVALPVGIRVWTGFENSVLNHPPVPVTEVQFPLNRGRRKVWKVLYAHQTFTCN